MKLIRALITEYGADVNIRGNKRNPLHMAVNNIKNSDVNNNNNNNDDDDVMVEVVRLLLEADASKHELDHR